MKSFNSGQLLSKLDFNILDIAETLSTEVAEDSSHVAKLRTAIEAVDAKKRKILQQTRSDMAILTLDDESSPVRNPCTAAEDARLESLVSLDGILKIVKDVMRQSSMNTLSKSRKKAMVVSLDELAERMPSLLDIDHPCAQRHIEEARHAVESSDQTEGGRSQQLQIQDQQSQIKELDSQLNTVAARQEKMLKKNATSS